jgi:hypothetical protein
MKGLATETEAVLRLAGWQPDRRIDPAPWITQLEAERFTRNEPAVAVLANLGGLQLAPTSVNQKLYCPDIVHFDPVIAASGDRDKVAMWEEHCHMSLFPIAEVQGGPVVCCSPTSVFILAYGLPLLFLGNSVEEMLNQLVCGRRRFPNFLLPQA